MQRTHVPYQKILFVCVNRREPHETCCAHRDSEAIAASLKARIKALGLSRQVRVSKSGCQDLCAKGPNVMVFPDNVWYHPTTWRGLPKADRFSPVHGDATDGTETSLRLADRWWDHGVTPSDVERIIQDTLHGLQSISSQAAPSV